MNRRTALLVSTIGVCVLYAAAVVALGSPPGVNDEGPVIVKWMQEHHESVRWSTWLTVLSAPLFAAHVVLMRDWMAGTAGRFYLLGGTAVLILTTVSSWVMLGLARRPESLDPALARTLLDVSAYWGPSLTGFTVLTLGAVAWVSLQDHRLPRWVGILAIVALVEQAVETVTVFGTSGFTAAGGPMNTMVGAGLTILTWLVAGIVVARQQE